MKILVVDDSSAMRMIVSRHLKASGWGGGTLLEASNGAEALQLARRHEPDLVLADWNMPEMTGIELFRALKKERHRARVGFITSEVSEASRRAVVDEGALFVLAKPFGQEELSQALAETMPASPILLAEADEVGALLSKLFDRRVSARPGMPAVFGDEAKVLVGCYQRGDSRLVGLSAMDARLCAFAASALLASPPSETFLKVRKGELTEELVESGREVLNVCSRLFAVTSEPVVRLREVHLYPPRLPTEVAVVAAQPSARRDLQVDISGYGGGSLSLFAR